MAEIFVHCYWFRWYGRNIGIIVLLLQKYSYIAVGFDGFVRMKSIYSIYKAEVFRRTVCIFVVLCETQINSEFSICMFHMLSKIYVDQSHFDRVHLKKITI
jgi:hypothetical protein